MLRAQLEEKKKAILQRINQEGKAKLEKVCRFNFSSNVSRVASGVFAITSRLKVQEK